MGAEAASPSEATLNPGDGTSPDNRVNDPVIPGQDEGQAVAGAGQSDSDATDSAGSLAGQTDTGAGEAGVSTAVNPQPVSAALQASGLTFKWLG